MYETVGATMTDVGDCVYIIKNNSWPGLYKIGRTSNFIDRLKTHNHGGSSYPHYYEVEKIILCFQDYKKVEKKIHIHFKSFRINQKEFFKLTSTQINNYIESEFANNLKYKILDTKEEYLIHCSGKTPEIKLLKSNNQPTNIYLSDLADTNYGGMTAVDFMVLMTMQAYFKTPDCSGLISIKIKTLTTKLGMGRTSIFKTIKKLEKMGYVEVDRSGRRNMYKMNIKIMCSPPPPAQHRLSNTIPYLGSTLTTLTHKEKYVNYV